MTETPTKETKPVKSDKPESRENKNFVMFYRSFMDDVTELAGANYTAYRLLMLLCKHMDGRNALIISMKALSEILGVSRQTISNAVQYLKKHDWVCVMKSGSANVYIVNPQVAWTSYAGQKNGCKYANLEASVLLTGSENAAFLNNPRAFNRFKSVDTDFLKSVANKEDEFNERVQNLKKDNGGHGNDTNT